MQRACSPRYSLPRNTPISHAVQKLCILCPPRALVTHGQRAYRVSCSAQVHVPQMMRSHTPRWHTISLIYPGSSVTSDSSLPCPPSYPTTKILSLLLPVCFLALHAVQGDEVSSARIAAEGEPPVSHIDTKEAENSPETEWSAPESTGTSFSRMTRPAYVSRKTGQPVIEYILPKLCSDGPDMFLVECCSLSPDGKELTVHRQRFFSSSRKVGKFIYKVTTSIPYRFAIKGNFYVFGVNDSEIESCDVFRLRPGQEKPAFLRRIYPSDACSYGLFYPM